MRDQPRAVLWDMDGTLVDSEEYHWLAWRETLALERVPITRADVAPLFAWRTDAILRRLLGSDVTPAEIDRIGRAKENLYRRLVRDGGVALLPGVRDWLSRLRADGWRQAVASSAPPLNLQALLAVLDIEACFETIVSAEEVEHGKPDPAVFLLAARRLGVHPTRCVVVEDAPAGVEAAHRGGMRAVGVLTTHDKLSADVVVRQLDELAPDTFERLI